MTDLVVLARSGAGGELVAQTLRELGLTVISSTNTSIEPRRARIAVTYPFELFPEVMTDHWTGSVLTSPLIWAEYRQHLPCMQQIPELASQLTLDDWARNVDNAMRNIIGKYDLLNGSLEAYQRDLSRYAANSPLALDTIELASILYEPERAVELLALVAGVEQYDHSGLVESLSTRVTARHERCAPWLEAYRKSIERV